MAFDDTGEGDKPEPPICEFTEGDLIHLKSGGPQLVVGSVADGFVVEFHWFDGAKLCSDELPCWCFIKCDHQA